MFLFAFTIQGNKDMNSRPVIGMVCDIKQVGQWEFHAVGDKYINAIQKSVGDVILIPALADKSVLERLMNLLDGIFFPGSYSNVDPQYYKETDQYNNTLHDPARDQTALPLILMALQKGIPILGICRGLQEINVALGGSLYQHIQELPEYLDHREPNNMPIAIKYAEAHEIKIEENSLLQSWLGTSHIRVNSLHQQGIKDLAAGLTIEATAPDGLIEAFRINDAPIFGYAVQWHPEWQFDQNPSSIAIFKAFQNACTKYKEIKQTL